MTNFNNIYRRLTSTVEKAIQYDSTSTYTPSFDECMDRFLDKGIVFSEKSDSINHGTFSFTNGELEGIYVIASVETYSKYAGGVGAGIGNIYSNTETALKAFEAAQGNIFNFGRISVDGIEVANNISSGSELFLSSIMKIEDISTDDDRLRDKGIIESSYLRYSDSEGERLALENIPTGFSFLKKLINHYSSGVLGTTSSFGEVVDRLIDKGLVIKINPTHVCVASVETYLKLAEAVG
jgi:hypothetical protein